VGLAIGRMAQPKGLRSTLGWFGFALFSSNAPDLDFLAGLVFEGINDFHRGSSHTLLAAVVYGLVSAVALQLVRWKFWPTFFTATALYSSHVLLDACTGDVNHGAGARLLWPFSDHVYASPWLIFRGIRHGHAGDSLATFVRELATRDNVVHLQYELLLSLPILLVAYYFFHCPFRAARRSATGSTPNGRSDANVAET